MSFDTFSQVGAAWIWSDLVTRPYHQVVCFRRGFELAAMPKAAQLHVTADSRYELFVNGQWLGFGPVRSWLSPWPVDTYDIGHLLQPGRNVVAILAHHPGLSTFQYIDADAGVIAVVEAGGKPIVTDASWRCRPHDGFAWPVPRISCMQPWEEQFDARTMAGDWTAIDFDDADWPAAAPMHAAGQGPHDRFEPRDIPFLTREPVSPTRLLAVEAVRPAPITWSLNPRDLLNPHDKTAENVRGRMLLTTNLFSEAEQSIQFHQPHGRPNCQWKLNGEALKFDDHSLQKTDTGVAHARLRAGRNTLMCRLPGQEHYWWAVMNAWPEQTMRATPWLAAGPFGDPDAKSSPPVGGHDLRVVDAERIEPGATVDRFEGIWSRGSLSDEDLAAPFVRPLTADMVATADVYAQCASERVVASTPRVEEPSALVADTAQWTTIHPVAGADVRLLLDFGREVVGFHAFEIDAPAGTIVDNHNFEFIQPDGRFNLAEGMNNSFRYTCREGAQRYRTLARRGFRYSWLSFRNFDRPIRVRNVHLLMSTYPQAGEGSFACSDAKLDRIWQVGVHSVRCCSEDTYTDCPTYEQTFWVGDARNEALVDLIANGDSRLSARSLRVAARSLDRSPLVESQVPSGWQNILPAWSFLWMRWAQEHFELTGDVEFGKEMIGWLARNVEGIEASIGPRGLINRRAWNLFDWAPMDTPAEGEVTHVSCLAVLGLRQAAELATAVKADDAARGWRALADRLASAVNTHLWDDAHKAYLDSVHLDGKPSTVFSQQTQTAAYISGIADSPERHARCLEVMLEAPKGFVTAGSPFYMFFLLEGLAREGRFDSLLTTIRDYWGKQIDAGATTFWEMYQPDQPRLTRSHCHGWSAAPTYFLTRHLLGISPAEPGYAKVRVEPRPNAGGVTWARGSVPTPRGVIECDWSLADNGQFSLRLVLPDGVPAEILLPSDGTITARRGTFSKSNAADDLSRPVLLTMGPVLEVVLDQ
jgi:alpha-L-rhamnosidase